MSRTLEELRVALTHSIERAQRSHADELCLFRGALAETPSMLDVFGRAEKASTQRFYLGCAEREFELVGVGSADSWHSRDPAPIARARTWATESRAARDGASATADPSTGAVWVGGFAFDPAPARPRAEHWQSFGAARLTLPNLTLLKRSQHSSLYVAHWVSPDSRIDEELARLTTWLEKPGALEAARAPLDLELDSRALADYRRTGERLLEAIQSGAAEKVVIACEEAHHLHAGFRPSQSLQNLQQTHPGSITFAQGIGAATFVGATPELLVQRSGSEIQSAAVAATTRRDGSAATEAELARKLFASAKEQHEHSLVVESIRRALTPLCKELDIPNEPRLLRAGSLQHLYTPIRGSLRSSDGQIPHILELVERLHPTPALGGFPHAAALDLIRSLEGFDRGWYAGPIGWFDERGDGEFFVALRCALATPECLRLYAGSGFVGGSSAVREAAETRLKLASIRGALDPW